MKIHSDILTHADLTAAAQRAGVTFHRREQSGSRSRARKFDVILEGGGQRAGFGLDYVSATWDEWGIFLGELFRRDPNMHCTYYLDADHYHWSTGNRFRDLRREQQHKRHKWECAGRSVGSGYWVYDCTCGARRRQLASGWSWEDVA